MSYRVNKKKEKHRNTETDLATIAKTRYLRLAVPRRL